MKSYILLLIPVLLFGRADPNFFKEFKNRYFVETGSHIGESIEEALKSGFQEIYSVELSEKWYAYCGEKFAGILNVHLWQGDSGDLLGLMIADIDEPITFWLDSHYSGGVTAKGMNNTPILRELEAIKQHPIKTHTILIDDVRCFGTEDFDQIQLSQVLEILKEINPEYQITFRNGHAENDILVARVQEL